MQKHTPRSEKVKTVRRGGHASARGRPAVHKEAWSKVTVVLFNRQIADVDGLIAEMRGRTGATLSRTLVIRSLIDALLLSDVDVLDCRTEADLRGCITDRLTTPHRKPRRPFRKRSVLRH